jgi:hypothetical protein
VFPASACSTAQDSEEAAGPSAESVPSGSVGADTEQVRSEGGPLRTDGSATGCSWNPSRVFVLGDDILETSEPVEIETLQLVNGLGVHIVSAWVMPSVGIPLTGTWVEWPLPKDAVRGKARLHWEERERAAGARLDPGKRYNLIVRMRREPGSAPQGFDAVRVGYRTSERTYFMEAETSMSFRATPKRCP